MQSKDLIPRDKHDIERVNALIAAGPKAAEPILEELLTWLQDINWPVAGPLAAFLVTVGEPLIPHIQKILISNDEIWIYWVLQNVVAKLSPKHVRLLESQLYALATESENDIVAIRIAAAAENWDQKTLMRMIDSHIAAYEGYLVELKALKLKAPAK